MADQPLRDTVAFRVTPTDRLALDLAAERAGVSLGELLRRRVLPIRHQVFGAEGTAGRDGGDRE